MLIRNPKDFWAGLMFIAFGLFFLVFAVGSPEFIDRILGAKLIPGYQFGSAVRMGPAYFPAVLGGLLALLGAIILLRSFASHLSSAATAMRLPFSIFDLAVAAAVFIVMVYIAKVLSIANDYAMLASALIVSLLAILYRPESKALILILASSLAFAYLLKPLGLILASAALVFICAYGGHEFRWKEVVVLAVVLAIFSVLVFVKALMLPFPIWPAFVE